MVRKIVFSLVAVVIATTGAHGGAALQTVTGTLEGRVTDMREAAIAGATITAISTDTGLERKTMTTGDGFYRVPYLPLGRYRISAEAPGFKIVTKEGVEIRLNETTVVPFSLEPAPVREEVTVTATDIPTINTTSGEIKTSFDSQVVTDRPLATRNFLSLAEIVPGFQSSIFSGQNNPTLSTGSSINFNGTGTRGATFQTDGVNNDDSSENQNRQGVNISTIKQFQILSNNYTAEFGRGYGAVVLVQTKSGTNEIHGDIYWFHQNSRLNANSFFSNAAGSRVNPVTGQFGPVAPVPPSRRHQYGFTAGGPLKKNRLFWFGSFEQTRLGGSITLTRDILLPNERTPDPSVTDPADRKWIQDQINRFPNVLPNNPASPRAFTTTTLFSWPDQDYTGRLDYRLSDHDNLVIRYQYTRQKRQTADVIIGEQAFQNHKQQNLGLTETHIFTPTTVGEVRLGLGLRTTLVNIAAGNDTPVIRFSGTTFPSIIGNAGAFPIQRYQTDWQLVYNLTTLQGDRHNLKFGTDIRRGRLDDLADNFSRGFWTFATFGGFNAYQNFLRGFVSTFTKGYGEFFLENRLLEGNYYVQDDIRLTPRFILNVGLRHEIVAAPKEIKDRIGYGYGTDADNLEPRFGFAWSPTVERGWLARLVGAPGNFVIRGGYGIFHGRQFQSIFAQGGAGLRFNPPRAALLSFFNSSRVSDPTGGFVFTPGPPTARVSVTFADPNLQLPYTQQWNLTLERQFPWQLAVSVSYNGNRGIGLPFYDWSNRAEFPACAPNHPFVTERFRGVCFDKIDPNLNNSNPAPGFISRVQPRINERRPDPRYSNVLTVTNASWSYYHGLQLRVDKRLSNGLSFNIAWTWSKAVDTGSEATFSGLDANAATTKVNAARSLRAVSAFDTPHRLTINYSYYLPFFKNLKGVFGHLLSGWQVAGTTTFASGNPFTVFIGYDFNADGIGFDRPLLVDPAILGRSVDNPRPDPMNPSRQIAQSQLPSSAFFPNASVPTDQWPFKPGLANVGNLGRNTFRADGTNNWDFGLYKNFKVTETHTVSFRAEFYNLLNHPTFNAPVQTVTATTFGRITSQRNSPRFLQFAFRYIF